MLRQFFFKTTAQLTKQYKQFNSFRHSAAPALLFGGIGGGTILGGGAGFGAGVVNSISTYKKSDNFKATETFVETSMSTAAGGVGGAVTGLGVSLSILAPEAFLIGAIGALAYDNMHHQNSTEEKNSKSLRC